MHHDIKKWCQESEHCQIARDTPTPTYCLCLQGPFTCFLPKSNSSSSWLYNAGGMEWRMSLLWQMSFQSILMQSQFMTNGVLHFTKAFVNEWFCKVVPGHIHPDQGNILRATLSNSSAVCTAQRKAMPLPTNKLVMANVSGPITPYTIFYPTCLAPGTAIAHATYHKWHSLTPHHSAPVSLHFSWCLDKIFTYLLIFFWAENRSQ